METAGRVVLATGGSLGDIHPVIALGKALNARGLRAEIATAVDHRAKIEIEGLGFHEVGPSLARLEADTGMDLAGLTAAIARSDRFLFENIMLAYAEASARQMIAVSEGAAAIVGLSFAVGARLAAERHGTPFVAVALQPTTVFSAYDPPHLPHAPWLKPAQKGFRLWLNRTTMGLGRRTTAPWTRRMDAVRAALDLPPGRGDIFFDALNDADLALGLYSSLLSPRQPDAPKAFEVVGYAPYDSEAGGPSTLPPALAAFLDAGPPPLVFTLGSAAVNIPGRFYAEGLKAARALGRRAVLLVGAEGDLSVADGPDALAVPYAPYSLLFPHAEAVVHQGGVGTIHQALRAGRPQLVVPHLGDQYDNGARIARLGCGAVLARERFQAGRVAATLETLMASSTVERAAALRDQARAEDGAADAADRIARLIGS